MADPTPPTPSLLRRTATDRRRLLTLADGRPVLAAAIPLIRRVADRLGRENALFFARPSLARDGGGVVRSITWYGPSGERPVRFSSLDGRDRSAVEATLSARLKALAPLLDDPAMGPLLSTALVVPALDDILVLGRLPVLTGWGTVPAEVTGAAGVAAHFDGTLGAYAPFGLSVATLRQAMGAQAPEPDATGPDDPEPDAPESNATGPEYPEPDPPEAAMPAPSPPQAPAPSTGPTGKTKRKTAKAKAAPAKTAATVPEAPPNPGAPAADGLPPAEDTGPKATAPDSERRPGRVPASAIAAAAMALLLGLSFVPGVVETRPVAGAGPSDEALATVQAINATLARNIAAADSLAGRVCEAEPTPGSEAERARLLLPDPATLAVPTASVSVETRLEAQTLRLETVPALAEATPDFLGSLTLIGPTTAIGPDIGRRPGEVSARADDAPLPITAIQPLPDGLALFELAAAAPGAADMVGTAPPAWRTPVLVAFAAPVSGLPDTLLAAGSIANGAPGAAVPDAVGLVHTAPVADAAGGGVYDLCGRLIAVARPLDGAAVPLSRLTRALSAAGAPVSLSDQTCQPNRQAGTATGPAG